MAVADVAIVVVDPDPARAALAAPALRTLDELGIPHLIFVNRIDQAHGRIRDLLTALQPMSVSPLIARQIPIREGEKVTGFVDVALERAYHYSPGKPDEPIALPDELAEREAQARTQMLEQLADHDDNLLEQLLMDQVPEPGTIFADLARETSENLGVSVLFGSAQNRWGVGRLLKALRHEAPGPESTAARLGVDAPALYAFKIYHGGSVGRLALARAIGGPIHENSDFKSSSGEHGRLGALFSVQGDKTGKIAEAGDGDVVAVAKVDAVKAGEWLGSGKLPPPIEIALPSRNCALAIEPADRKDDVKLSGALARMLEEDAEPDPRAGRGQPRDAAARRQRRASEDDAGQAEAPLRGRGEPPRAVDRLSRIDPQAGRPSTGRHKKQSGGHGQFGDVIIEIRPLARGEGFQFEEKIHGGAIPKQWIPAVEQGVKDAMLKGPARLPGGRCRGDPGRRQLPQRRFSELAFRLAGRIAMQEALAQAVAAPARAGAEAGAGLPSSAASRVSSAVASRRGQMLGMGPRDGWTGWDRIEALIPEAELDGLEAELRSLSQGLASYEAEFDHLAELNGHLADKVVQQHEAEPA